MDVEVRRLARELRAKYGSRLRQIFFFGSGTRGRVSQEAAERDCLLVFDQVTPQLKSEIDHLAAKWLVERGIVSACIALSESDFERLRYEPFLHSVRREGIAA